jgi:hypothetical protein
MVEMHLQITPAFVARIVQLHSAMQSSSAVMLVGAAGCGKTIATTVLAKALTRVAFSITSTDDSKVQTGSNRTELSTAATEVEVIKIYPNTLTFNELYGQYDDTNERWRDGLLSKLIPSTTAVGSNAATTPQQTWLVLDADFSYTSDDSVPVAWAEAFTSTVTAAAPCISLSNLKRMPLSSQQHNVKLLFETSDIHCASPAILSRCSVVKFKEAGQVSYTYSVIHTV